MADNLRKTIARSRNRVIGVTKSLDELNEKLTSKIDQLQSTVQELQKDQSKLDRQQTELHINLSNQLRNSGILQINENEILVKIFNGLKIYLDTRDIAVVPHIALDGIWEPEITAAWLSMIKPNDVVFDIGANFGYYGLLAAHKTNKKNSKVIFVEANPNLIKYINKTISLNWYNEQSIVENFAVSDRKHTVVLNVLKEYIGSSSVQSLDKLESYMGDKMQLEVDESIQVPAITLDGYCKDKNIKEINLIKMDIEGYEENAYSGMRQIIKQSPNVTMFVEFTKDGYENPKQFYDSMLSDFGNVYIIDGTGKLTKPKRNSYEYVIGDADDWVMPVFSKDKTLAELTSH